MQQIESLLNLVEAFRSLPGIGAKSAQKLAYHILELDDQKVEQLIEAIKSAKHKVHYCSSCFTFTDTDPCEICASQKRERRTICVVETPQDVASMERARNYTGLYHVLHGLLSPMHGKGPDDLKIKELVGRLDGVDEVIVATNPTVEGEATAFYLAKLLKPLGIKVSRIAHGIPVGAELGYTDEITLARAMENRREM